MRSELRKLLRYDPMKTWWFGDRSPEARQAWRFVFTALQEARKDKDPVMEKEVLKSLMNKRVFTEYVELTRV